ncbi:MAG: cation diffusion facilitator family transporter [Chloroflexi bacterium]|nr:cation diffusion facilitator family transporter [Chloroflexota bacterium]
MGTSNTGELRGLQLSLLLYSAIFAAKLVAYFLTGIMALLAEALHTLSDIFISSFLMVALLWSRREADVEHMLGHGRAQNVAALVAATLFISFTSYKLYEESARRLLSQEVPSYSNPTIAIVVLSASMVVAAFPLIGLYRQSKRGAAASAQIRELINDELGLAAALAGTLFVAREVPLADPLASMAVATVILVSAALLLRQNASFLIGRSPGPDFLAEAARLSMSVEGVLGVSDMRAEYVGPDIVNLGMHIRVRRGITIEDADHIAEEVRRLVHEHTGCRYCLIHVDPAEPSGTLAELPQFRI